SRLRTDVASDFPLPTPPSTHKRCGGRSGLFRLIRKVGWARTDSAKYALKQSWDQYSKSFSENVGADGSSQRRYVTDFSPRSGRDQSGESLASYSRRTAKCFRPVGDESSFRSPTMLRPPPN